MTKQRKQMTINLLLAMLELDSNEVKALKKDLNKLTLKSLDLLILQINRI